MVLEVCVHTLIFVSVFHRILDFKTGLYFYAGPFLFYIPAEALTEQGTRHAYFYSHIRYLRFTHPFSKAINVQTIKGIAAKPASPNEESSSTLWPKHTRLRYSSPSPIKCVAILVFLTLASIDHTSQPSPIKWSALPCPTCLLKEH